MSVAIGIQHAMRMRHVVIRSLFGSIIFLILSHKWYCFREKKSYLTWNVCFDFFLQVLSETFIILRRTERDIIINIQGDQNVSVRLMITIKWSGAQRLFDHTPYIGLHVKYPLSLSDFNGTLIFWAHFFKNTQLSSFMENRPVGAELLHTDGNRTGMKKLIVALCNSANTSIKNDAFRLVLCFVWLSEGISVPLTVL